MLEPVDTANKVFSYLMLIKCSPALSVFGSAVFNLGSVLGWALCRSVLKSAQEEATPPLVFRAVLGAVGALGALSLARGYLAHVDTLAESSSKSRLP